MSATQQTWPEGVIARYLTVGGATVDISIPTRDDGSEQEAASTCGGCTEVHHDYRATFGSWPADNPGHARYCVTVKAREWAQDHAETCRAMPRPEAGR